VLAVRTAGANFVGVAEYVLAAVLGHARRLDELSRATHQGEWDGLRATWSGRLPELRGQTIGLIGFGAIARHVATLAGGFGMHVLAHDPFVGDDAVRASGATPTTLGELLSGADVVSVHATLNDANTHLLDRRLLGLMKPSALLVNTARGPLVDQAAVAELLADGAIGGAVLDVLEQEPPDPGDPILTAPNCVVTPHLAGCTEDGYVEIGQVAARLVHEFVTGRRIAEHHVVRPRGR
jgi:phosphoglycerate dehydrogenase-like enzyme